MTPLKKVSGPPFHEEFLSLGRMGIFDVFPARVSWLVFQKDIYPSLSHVTCGWWVHKSMLKKVPRSSFPWLSLRLGTGHLQGKVILLANMFGGMS